MVQDTFKRIDALVGESQIHPFDFVNNPIFYNPRPEQDSLYYKQLQSSTAVGYIAVNEAYPDVAFTFRPSSMSNGWLAYQYVESVPELIRSKTEGGHLTTQDLSKKVARTEMMAKVIMPNAQKDHASADRIERQHPEIGAVVPIGYEAALRQQRLNQALSQGATYQDWTFETWWIPRVIDSSRMVLGNDHAFSRYANMEELAGDMIQAGLVDDYRKHVGPGKDYDIVDESGDHITLADRAWERAKHIVYVIERGFVTDLSVATLIAQFQLDDWLEAPEGRSNPIKRNKLHPTLKNRSAAEKEQMAQLKEIMLPYLAQKGLYGLPYEEDKHLKRYVERQILPHADEELDIENVVDTLFSHQPKGGFNYPDADAAEPQSDTVINFNEAAIQRSYLQRPAKIRASDGQFFSRPSRIFDDHLFDDLEQWEQAAVPFVLGAMESVRLPESAPRSFMYLNHAKGGKRALDFIQKKGQEGVREVQSDTDPSDKSSFANKVIRLNKAERNKERDLLAENPVLDALGVGNVITTENFERIAKGIEDNRDFCAARGQANLTSKAFLAMMTEWLDRTQEGLIVRDGWAAHHDEVYLMTRAVMIATGLVERPYDGGDCNMEMFQTVKSGSGKAQEIQLKKMDFFDIFKDVYDVTSMYLDMDAETPEHYMAASRLIHILDAYIDPHAMNTSEKRHFMTGDVSAYETIHWDKVNADLMQFMDTDPVKRQQILEMRADLRAKILQVGVKHMNPNDMHEMNQDFIAAANTAHGIHESESRRDFDGNRVQLDRNNTLRR